MSRPEYIYVCVISFIIGIIGLNVRLVDDWNNHLVNIISGIFIGIGVYCFARLMF